jgi:hypothetical protein
MGSPVASWWQLATLWEAAPREISIISWCYARLTKAPRSYSALAAVTTPKLFDSIIFVEPMIGPFTPKRIAEVLMVIPGVFAKRDSWSSRYVYIISTVVIRSYWISATKQGNTSVNYRSSLHGILQSLKPTSNMALPKVRQEVFASKPLQPSYVETCRPSPIPLK